MIRRLACFLLAAFLVGLAAAYPADNDYIRLARLSYIEGHVSLQYASDVEWSAASVNLPLEPGDRIYTGRDGRAEIEFDEGSIYRLAEDTDIEILSLNENLIQLRILVGLSSLTVSSGLDFEINTPAAAFVTIRQGIYRFDVGESGETAAIVRKGELEAANNELVRRIQDGEMLSVRLGGGAELARYGGRDSWDEWTDRRSADMRAYTSREYLPDTVYIGASDLDRYGRWVTVESYGRAWVPFSVGVSWSPYSVGRWCYRPFYGWTWVSYEPWGWLPYHYGRWYRSVSFGWCWLPGASFSFNFWSPGLVAFYNGPGWVSWCPLGPGDYYSINHYHYNRKKYGYQVAKLRTLHTRAAGRPLYRNDRGAFRTVSKDQFRNGSPRGNGVATRQGYVNLASREGSYVKDRLDIKPTSASYNAAPGRPTSRPKRASELPAVVRTDPGTKTNNRGGYTKVTNPRISSASSRAAAKQNEAGTRGGARTSDPAVRVVRFGSSAETGQGVRSQSGNNASSDSQRRANVRNNPVAAERNGPAVSNSEARRRVEQSRPASTPAPSASNSARRSGSSSDTARAPVTRTYSVPKQSSQPAQRNSFAASGSQARPRVEQSRPARTPAPSTSSSARRSGSGSSAARAPATRSNSVPKQSGPSIQRNGAVRSSRTPSSGSVGGNSAQPSARSGVRSSSSRSSGQAQSRSNSGSSGAARRK